jgi:hypothetical protein
MSSENQETSIVTEVTNQTTTTQSTEVMNNTQNQLSVSQPDETPVTNVGNYDEDMKKYTKIDNLDEDPVVDSGRFFLVSFISPEGVMNCTMRGLKIRTYKNKVVFQTLEEAKVAADEINKKDKYFNVFVGEPGKWMGWDPAPDDRKFVEEEKWDNSEQNDLMQGLRKREENKLKELNALVGKKKDIVNKEKKTHDQRVKNALKKNAEEYKANKEGGTTEQPENNSEDNLQTSVVTEEQKIAEEKKIINDAKKNHNANLVKDRLRKKMREKEASAPPPTVTMEERNNAFAEFEKTATTKTKLDENIKKLNSILEKAKQTKK